MEHEGLDRLQAGLGQPLGAPRADALRARRGESSLSIQAAFYSPRWRRIAGLPSDSESALGPHRDVDARDHEQSARQRDARGPLSEQRHRVETGE